MDFFVVGTSRSGSTLLRSMLAEHPSVAILNETHWLPRMCQVAGTGVTDLEDLISIVSLTEWDTGQRVVDVNLELVDKSWESLVYGLREKLGQGASVAAFHDALVDEIFDVAPGAVLRGDKTPDYGFYMTLLQILWPKARFVHIVRNGIDTARSMSLHPGCQLMISAGYDNWVPLSYGQIYRHYQRRKLPFGRYVASWRRRMECIRREAAALSENSYLEVRYETLLVEPARVLRQVAAHLGLEPTDSWLSQSSRMVRPRAVSEPLTPETLRELTIEDLRVLNDVGGVPFFLFMPDCSSDWLQAALKLAVEKQNGMGDPLRVAIGVLATQTAADNAQLRSEALHLLNDEVTSRGDDPQRWVVLSATDPLG